MRHVPLRSAPHLLLTMATRSWNHMNHKRGTACVRLAQTSAPLLRPGAAATGCGGVTRMLPSESCVIDWDGAGKGSGTGAMGGLAGGARASGYAVRRSAAARAND
jgi:hypothetical protein